MKPFFERYDQLAGTAGTPKPTLSGIDESPPKPPVATFAARGADIGRLVDSKQEAYGDSVGKTGRILAVLYPAGVRPEQYDDALLIVRVLDKLSRLAVRGSDGKDRGGESPWKDIAGYGMLGERKDGAKP